MKATGTIVRLSEWAAYIFRSYVYAKKTEYEKSNMSEYS